jgi:hypothetical protein
MLEGLDGAAESDSYKFHVERGYGVAYHTDADAKTNKASFLSKSGRETRNRDRQSSRGMSKEEQQRHIEAQKKKQADEKELSKKLQQVEKQRKDKV